MASPLTEPTAQLRSLAGIVAVGLVLLASARVLQRSPFFRLPREQYQPEHDACISRLTGRSAILAWLPASPTPGISAFTALRLGGPAGAASDAAGHPHPGPHARCLGE